MSKNININEYFANINPTEYVSEIKELYGDILEVSTQINKEFSFMDKISETLLEDACEYGLLNEVVYYALLCMKRNPKISIDEAILLGYNEWIK